MNGDTVLKGLLFDAHPEPIPNCRFQVYIQAFYMGFSKVSNIEESIETEAFQEGGVNDRVYSLKKNASVEKTMLFERGIAARGITTKLLTNMFQPGRRIATDILIIVLDRAGVPAQIYAVDGAVVKKWKCADLDAMGGGALIETFEVAYEKLVRLPNPSY